MKVKNLKGMKSGKESTPQAKSIWKTPRAVFALKNADICYENLQHLLFLFFEPNSLSVSKCDLSNIIHSTLDSLLFGMKGREEHVHAFSIITVLRGKISSCVGHPHAYVWSMSLNISNKMMLIPRSWNMSLG